MRTPEQWRKEWCVHEETWEKQPLWSEWIKTIQDDARADLLAELARLETLQRHHDLCRKALDVPENEPMLDAIEDLLERVKSARKLLDDVINHASFIAYPGARSWTYRRDHWLGGKP